MGKFPKERERKMVLEVEAECKIAVAHLEMEEDGRWEEEVSELFLFSVICLLYNLESYIHFEASKSYLNTPFRLFYFRAVIFLI